MLNDSHTHFFPPGQITKVKFGFEAIPIGKEIYISKVKAKGAAARAGLKVGDQVLRMNGLAPSRKNLGLMMLRFRVLRPVLELDLEVRRSPQVIKRVRIVAKTRTARVVGDRDNWWETFQWQAEDPERVEYSEHNGTLHVKIPNFLLSAGKIRQIAKRIQKHSAAVIDLRGNRGGYVRSLKWMLRHFVDEETDIGISLTRKKRDPLRVKPRKPHISTPIVILVDGDSASAAEVFTRYLQKKGRAQVIGDRTAGAVMISLTFPMEQGIDTVVPFAVQVTVGELRMADNESLEGVGVKPDIFLLPTQEDLQKERDPVLDRALEILQKIVDEKTGKSIPPPGTVEALQKYLELEPDGRFAAAARSRIHVATTSR